MLVNNPSPDRIHIFDRAARLTGPAALDFMGRARTIVFGIGGVGSWTAETLVRSGFADITLVDADCVAVSNINRQLPALVSTVGMPKVEVMRDHLLQINPEASVSAIQGLYDADSAAGFCLEEYDYIFDCIDSLSAKALLILNATEAMRRNRGVRFYSSMGAALKTDPSRISVAEFWKVKGCPLAAALRRRFKKSGIIPARKFKCVYSDELVPQHKDYVDPEIRDTAMTFGKVATNGSLMHITSVFGITLASLAVRDAMSR